MKDLSLEILEYSFISLLTIKPTRCTKFSNLFWNETTCFGQFLCPSSWVLHCTHSNGLCHTGLQASCQQTCMTYTIAVCTVKNSWWWTEELSETCRVSFQNKFEKLVHLVGFIIRIYHDTRSPKREILYVSSVFLPTQKNCVTWCAVKQ